jgi:hypothetical protein
MITGSMMNAGCDAVVEGLRAEFGAVLAARILEAEVVDFLWEARVKERYLGQHLDVGLGDADDDRELSRVATLSSLDGFWHVAACLVDGEGVAVDLLWNRRFDSLADAETTFDRAS